MPVGSRNYLTKFDARIFPIFSLIAITKIVRRTRAIKHHKLAEVVFKSQHMTQRRTQRCNSRAHRNKNQITPFNFVELEPMTCDTSNSISSPGFMS